MTPTNNDRPYFEDMVRRLTELSEELFGPTPEQKMNQFRRALEGGEYRMEIAGLEPLFPVGFANEDDLDMNEIRRAATEFVTSHVEVRLTEEQKDLLLRLWCNEEENSAGVDTDP